MPRRALREAHAQRPGQAARYSPSVDRRLVDVLKNQPGLFQEGLPRRAQPDTPGKAIEQLETDLTLEVLDLAGQGGLSDAQPLGGASVVLLLSNRHEVAQVP